MNLHCSRALSTYLLTLLAAAAANVSANPVVYTLRTVADGKIGTHVFLEALGTFQMRGDTANIVTLPSAFNGGTVFTNTGKTTLTIVDGTRIIFATLEDPLTVRYDTGAGFLGSGTLGVLLGVPPNA